MTDLVNHLCKYCKYLIQVHIPQRKSSKSFVFKMRCQVTSDTTHNVLISKEVSYKSYKEICSGEPKKVNLGFNNDPGILKLENNTLTTYPQSCGDFPFKPTKYKLPNPCIHGKSDQMSKDWEILATFFSIYNIKQNWLNCHMSWGSYDEELGGWTGCVGKV